MFNKKKWSRLIEDTYKYQARVFSVGSFELHYSYITNKIGEYIVAPAFGDYLYLTASQLDSVSEFVYTHPAIPVRLKILADCPPDLRGIITVDDGFIHDIQYRSYHDWKNNKIKCKFRNQINQGERNGLVVNISTSKVDLIKFWEMHAKLRIARFGEIPQPREFFIKFFKKYCAEDSFFIVQVFGPNSKLLAGIVVAIDNNVAYYKYAASVPQSLGLRPNNYLVDRLIYFLDTRGINRLNLGYTGSTDEYVGLRKFKLAMGAEEYTRYKLTTPSFSSLDRSIVKSVNDRVNNLVLEDIDLDKVNNFSNEYYKYFV